MSSASSTGAPDGIEQLVRMIADSGVHPIDVDHVAAILELNGWTDGRAVGLGYEDVFELAGVLFNYLSADGRLEKALVEEDPDSWFARVMRTVRLYLRGLSFAAPMLLSSASVLTLRFALWSYMDFNLEIATAIAIGTFGSFLVAGGFTQAIARRGLFYITQDQHGLARSSSLRLVLIGILVMLAAGGLATLFVVLVPILPWRMVLVSGLYYVPLTLIWIGTGLLYMLHREPTIFVLLAFGIGLVWFLKDIVGLSMMTAQAISMSLVAIFAFGLAVMLFFQLERANPKESELRHHIRWSQVSRSLAPFFLYGIAYFALTFIDRIMAWSRPNEFHPYFIWFKGTYELGLDWALWTLILPMGVVEIYIDGLFRRLSRRSMFYTISEIDGLNHDFRREHLRTGLLVLLTGLVGIGLIILLLSWLPRLGLDTLSPLSVAETRLVFFFAAPAFSIITVGLQGVLVLFSLNEPWAATRAVSRALAANIIIGFLASRLIADYWAVLGLVAGAILFAYFATQETLKVLDNLDYYLMLGT